MFESIVELARRMSSATEAEERSLEALCAASAESWSLRLRPGVTPEQCGSAYLCAAAFSAAAGLLLLRDGIGGGLNFTAGDVSVSHPAGAAARTVQALREQAERLMAPYAAPDDFAFRGVRT